MQLSGPCVVEYYEYEILLGRPTIYCCGYQENGNSYSAYWPHWALFCEECGNLWGRRRMRYQFDYRPRFTAEWKVLAARCARCGGGELLLPGLDNVDPPLVEREFKILLARYG